MEVYQFEQLLRSRFPSLRHRMNKVPESKTTSHIRCLCGEAMIFSTDLLAEWSMSTKNAITAWLMRHVTCKA